MLVHCTVLATATLTSISISIGSGWYYLGALDLLGIPILLMGSPPNLSIIIIGNSGSPK